LQVQLSMQPKQSSPITNFTIIKKILLSCFCLVVNSKRSAAHANSQHEDSMSMIQLPVMQTHSRGANAFAEDSRGFSPFSLASWSHHNHKRMPEHLISDRSSSSPQLPIDTKLKIPHLVISTGFANEPNEIVKDHILINSPKDSEYVYFNDSAQKASAKEISLALEQVGIYGAYDAYAMLRPGAFRADLWRYMALWWWGGVYLDDKVKPVRPLSDWVDFDQDQLALTRGFYNCSYWNGMMAASPRNALLLEVIERVIGNVQHRFYGWNPLEITGPWLLFNVVNDSKADLSHMRAVAIFANTSIDRVDTEDLTLAEHEESIHSDTKEHSDYDALWWAKAVYCDEPGPPGVPETCL